MSDLLKQEVNGVPVSVTLGGRQYPLCVSMAAVIIYKAETARIERSRSQAEDADQQCLCGQPRSAHKGKESTVVDADQNIQCWGFRLYDRLQGDSLYTPASWSRIDLDLDPERWAACLWATLHQKQVDGKGWKAPMTLVELSDLIPVGPGAREIAFAIFRALRQSSARFRQAEDESPNAAAPAEEKSPAPVEEVASRTPIAAT